ncbi:OPT family oligopeptide transporter [Paralcaligenes ureilyticus]|uniref:Putative OPT family oligopeptide transporter n=1 Tax=Paralcaligenes ureilyticus TaxID=627131 RepID=A0A4R3LQ67_9BURK|nr:oligopeptide transporter, OPT family [Paralcaligenes ureilyticus]TCT02351.1 putative OPT family oligopeptide transporter [Paralcaligenes ureilyticus]
MPSAQPSLKELTLRGVVLGAVITLIFTASNVYLGLKVGLTFASSIPAAVISMALLHYFKDSNILENNIVQTQASAAGALSAIIFVLPALLMLGYWQGFPLFQTAMICAAGGILGVIFTVPLRHALVVKSDLPYPEGVAAAEILRAGNQHPDAVNEHPAAERIRARPGNGLLDILAGAAFSGAFSLLTNGFKLAADSASYWLVAGRAIFQIPMGFSFALVGAGYLVGIVSGIAMLIGVLLSWGIAVPWLTAVTPMPAGSSAADFAMTIWVSKVRLIGAGMIAIAAIWTLLTLLKPMYEGMKISLSVLKGGSGSTSLEHADTDLSPKALVRTTLLMLILLAGTFYSFIATTHVPTGVAWTLVAVSTLVSCALGFMVAAACGYMAGLVGSSASPISGIAIVSIMAIAMIFIGIGESQGLLNDPANIQFFTALTLFCTSVVVAIAAISNDNLQDLKTGWLVHATPWRQQVALIIGCVVGALAIPPVLDLLYQAYGFIGAMPRADMNVSQALSAPQATLMITIVDGLFAHTLDWTYILIGIAAGVAVIIIDVILARCTPRYRLPSLAVAMGLYLPPSIVLALFVGTVISWYVKRRIHQYAARQQIDVEPLFAHAERKGTLFASGLIVGESLIGVVLAMTIVVSVSSGGSDRPLALVGRDFAGTAMWIGLILFVAMCLVFARRTLRRD